MKTTFLSILVVLLVGCGKYDSDDKVCNHRLGICQGDVMRTRNAGKFCTVMFKPLGEAPEHSVHIGNGWYEVEMRQTYWYTHEDDEYPIHEE